MPSYNNYFPMSYQPMTYGYQQPQYQPIMPQPQYNAPTPTPAPSVNTPTGIIWVNRDEAMSFAVAPNSAVALWDRNEPIIYLKQADGTGKPTIKIYDLVERADKPVENSSGAEGKVTAYATKEELAAVLSVAKGFGGAIDEIKAEIDKLNGDMYGVAGKRKAAQKAKSEEGDE